jgi:hypothetical protein
MSDDQLPVDVGDHVQDRDDDDDDATMVVVGVPVESAVEYRLSEDGPTVADVNPDYPAGDDVVEAVFPERTDVDISSRKRYAYPRSRLEVVARVHDRTTDDADETAAAAEEVDE